MAFAWTRTSAGPSFPSDAFTHCRYSSSESNAVSKAGLLGLRPRVSPPKFLLCACARHSFKVDSLMRWVTGLCANMPRVALIPVAWPGQVNTCQSVPTSYKTNMRKCMHNSQGEEGLLTIIYLENGHQHSACLQHSSLFSPSAPFSTCS